MGQNEVMDEEPSVVDEFSLLYNVYTLEKLGQTHDVHEMQDGGIVILVHRQNKKICLKHRTYVDRTAHRYELKVWIENWTVGIRRDDLEGLLLPDKPDEELMKLNNPLLKKRLDDMKSRGFKRFLPEKDKKGRVILRAILERPYSDRGRNQEAFYDAMVRPALIYTLREEAT